MENEIIIDLTTRQVSGKLPNAYVGDNKCNYYKIKIVRDKKIVDLTGKKIKLAFETNGMGDILDINITNAINGECEFELGGVLTSRAGRYNYQLNIYNDNGYLENTVIFSAVINNTVVEFISDKMVGSESFMILNEALKNVDDLQNKMKEHFYTISASEWSEKQADEFYHAFIPKPDINSDIIRCMRFDSAYNLIDEVVMPKAELDNEPISEIGRELLINKGIPENELNNWYEICCIRAEDNKFILRGMA